MSTQEREGSPPQSIPEPETLGYRQSSPLLAEEESRTVQGQIDLERAESQHQRDEKSRNLIAGGIRLLMGSIFSVAILAIFAFAWHSLVSVTYHWLNDDQLSVLRTVLFSGVIASAASSYFQKYS